MSDFDFDELDKAVTGALGTDTPSQDAPAALPSDSAKTPASDDRSARIEPEPRDDTPVDTSSRVAPAARRNAGRFMDVVHPSSDMRSRTSTAGSSDAANSSTPTTFTPPTDTPVVDTTDTSEKVESQADTDTAAQDTAWSAPLDSPFLPDAKVEKRPLGGTAPVVDLDAALGAFDDSSTSKQDAQELLDAPEEEPKLEAPDEQRLEAAMPDPIDFAGLRGDTALEEPKDAPLDTPAPEVNLPTEPELPAEPAPALDLSLENDAPVPPTPIATEPTPAVEEPIGPTSITQQYKEQPSAEQSSGAIYDTETYHQPLVAANTGKKHSGLWTILWIFLLVILGAGVGVAFYLFILPMF